MDTTCRFSACALGTCGVRPRRCVLRALDAGFEVGVEGLVGERGAGIGRRWAAEEAFEAGGDPAHAEDEEDDGDGSDAGGGVGVVGGEPGEGDGGNVFAGRERDVRERLGAGGGDECAGGGLGGVRDGRDGGSCDGGEELHLRAELRGGLVGEQRGYGHADEGVGGVPDEVEGGDLVGEDFDGEEDAGDDDDPGIGERVQAGREGDPVEAREDAEGGDRGVDVEAGGKAGGDDERGDGGWREVHGVSSLWGASAGMVSQMGTWLR